MSKQEARNHPQSARSIATYLNKVVLTEDDKEWIARIIQPKGWRAEFNDPDKLDEEGRLERSRILRQIKKFPALKVNSLK